MMALEGLSLNSAEERPDPHDGGGSTGCIEKENNY
jgi:hypothetical protein